MIAKDAVSQYIQALSGHRVPKTISTYGHALKIFLDKVGPDAELTQPTYEKFLDEIKNFNRSSKALYRSVVLGLYEYASSIDPAIDYAKIKFAHRLYRAKNTRRRIKINQSEIEQVIKYCETLTGDIFALRDRALVLTLADTGLRIHEACELERGSIDWLERRAVIVGKGDNEDVVRFSERSVNAIREYHMARKDGESGKPLDSLPVFARHDKGAGKKIKRLTTSGAWFVIKERIKQSGVSPSLVRIHDFRHYFVTVVYMTTNDIKLAQTMARHSTIAVTEMYAHVDGRIDQAYDEIFNAGEK